VIPLSPPVPENLAVAETWAKNGKNHQNLNRMATVLKPDFQTVANFAKNLLTVLK
jgi:hypothetical protein